MKKNNKVTPGQADEVRRMADAKGVTRESFQQALSDGRFAQFLDRLARNLQIHHACTKHTGVAGVELLRRAKKLRGWKNADRKALDFYLDKDNWSELPDCDILVFPNVGSHGIVSYLYRTETGWLEGSRSLETRFFGSTFVITLDCPSA